ncbi:MAG: AAA family ATPase [Bacilli bacterium]|nr:AAA family ATPase [Bacilli bacterium]
MSVNRAKIFTVTSTKGGTGKSTFLLQLASQFAKANQKVLIIDLDLYSGVIAPMLNINNDNDICQLIDDLNNNRFKYLEDYISKYNDNIDVLPSPKDPRAASKISMKYLNVVLSKAAIKYDTILIDTNHIIDEVNLMIFDYSDDIIYLLSNDIMDFKNIRTIMAIYKDMDHHNYTIVLNESFRKKHPFYSKKEIENLIKVSIDFILPNNMFIKNIDKQVIDGQIPGLNKKSIMYVEKICKYLLKDKK